MASHSVLLLVLLFTSCWAWKPREDKTKCPIVKAMRNFELDSLLGQWYVVQYYASSEEALAYKCMRAHFTKENHVLQNKNIEMQVTMNFTYSFINDPLNEQLLGNLTWQVPDSATPAHWVHAEDIYEGVYNTYVLDTDYTSWTLLMHCAEKEKSLRYMSSFIMSRNVTLAHNVISYLRDKLPRYGVDINYVFEMSQTGCGDHSLPEIMPSNEGIIPPLVVAAKEARKAARRHPMKRVHKSHNSGEVKTIK